MVTHPAGEDDRQRLALLLTFFQQRGVLEEWMEWWKEQRARPDYDGLSGAQIMDWIRAAHPALVPQAEAIIHS